MKPNDKQPDVAETTPSKGQHNNDMAGPARDEERLKTGKAGINDATEEKSDDSYSLDAGRRNAEGKDDTVSIP